MINRRKTTNGWTLEIASMTHYYACSTKWTNTIQKNTTFLWNTHLSHCKIHIKNTLIYWQQRQILNWLDISPWGMELDTYALDKWFLFLLHFYVWILSLAFKHYLSKGLFYLRFLSTWWRVKISKIATSENFQTWLHHNSCSFKECFLFSRYACILTINKYLPHGLPEAKANSPVIITKGSILAVQREKNKFIIFNNYEMKTLHTIKTV